MVFKPEQARNTLWVLFENDVKKYGIQTSLPNASLSCPFENDVKKYGIQTKILRI